MHGNAILLTSGLLDTDYAKTAHGLIRGSERFKILGVIDAKFEGQDAGEVMDTIRRDIPVFSSIKAANSSASGKIQYAIIGVATKGGIIPDPLMHDIKEAITSGYAVINGLHQYLQDIDEIQSLANENNVKLIDIRKPKPAKALNFWTGKINDIDLPIVGVLGTDCALGKRTTTKFLKDACRNQGIKAEMIFTGQTGWLQDGKYGFIFDATLNDFVSGEIEHAILKCVDEAHPDVIFVEGQASLLNPSGPCGAEFIISGKTNLVILQHAPARKYYNGWESKKLVIPPIEKNIALVEAFGAKVIGISLNTTGMNQENTVEVKQSLASKLDLPVVAPLYDGVEDLLPTIKTYLK